MPSGSAPRPRVPLAAIVGGLTSWLLIEVLVSGAGGTGTVANGDYAYALVGIGQAVPPQLIGLG